MAVCWWSTPGRQGFSLQQTLPSRPGAIRGCLAASGGRTLYIYPELYQGQECAKYVFCTGPTPAQNATNPSPTSSRRWAGSVSLMLAANYVAPRLYNKYAHRVIEANGGDCVL
jgi:hypothetical protein